MYDVPRPLRRSLGRPAVLAAMLLFAGTVGHAVLSAQGGAAARRTVWDGVYSDAQATRGTAAFSANCSNCHTLDDTGTRPLRGTTFVGKWTQRSVGDLIKYVSTNMPNGVNAGTLPMPTYLDLVALILRNNGFPAGAADLAPETGAGVMIQPKDGPGDLPAGTLVRVVGCLAPKSGADWTLTQATTPERIDKAGASPEDASRPLGDRTTALKFVLTRLDNFVGHRMSVSGLLVGPGGVNGINVTTVNRVAETCP
jgi:quinoprotein glucose dehydrogenase